MKYKRRTVVLSERKYAQEGGLSMLESWTSGGTATKRQPPITSREPMILSSVKRAFSSHHARMPVVGKAS